MTESSSRSDRDDGSRRSRIATFAFLLAGMTLFGSATPLSKIVSGEFPVFTASLFRVVIGSLILAPFLGSRLRSIPELGRRDWLAIVGVAAIGMFGFTTLLLYGMRFVPGVVGAIVMSSAPAVTATLSVLFLGEHWTARKWIAIALAVAGVTLVNVAGRLQEGSGALSVAAGSLLLGTVLVFGAVCCEAGYTILGKVGTRRLDPMLLVFLASATAVPMFLVPVVALEWGALHPGSIDVRGWTALVAWGAATLGLGSTLWYAGVRRAEGSVAAGFMGVMPVSALVFSYVLLAERVRWEHLVGFAVVLSGVIVISREHAEQAASENEES